MKAMLGISLYSYTYLKLAKTLCISYYYLYLIFKKIGEESRTDSAGSEVEGRQRRGQGRGWEAGSGEKWPKQCMHI
jgi:hypothetical protein